MLLKACIIFYKVDPEKKSAQAEGEFLAVPLPNYCGACPPGAAFQEVFEIPAGRGGWGVLLFR